MVNLTEMKSKPDIALSGDRTEASEQESKCEASKTVPDSGNRSGNALVMAAKRNLGDRRYPFYASKSRHLREN